MAPAPVGAVIVTAGGQVTDGGSAMGGAGVAMGGCLVSVGALGPRLHAPDHVNANSARAKRTVLRRLVRDKLTSY